MTATLLAVMDADLILSRILTRGISRFDPTRLMILWVLLAVLLAMITIAAIRATVMQPSTTNGSKVQSTGTDKSSLILKTC